MKVLAVLLTFVTCLSACAQPPAPTSAPPTATTAPAAIIVATATLAPAPVTVVVTDTAVAAPATDWLTTVSVVGDYYVLGNPAAPVRLIDYSDFL